MRLLLLLLVTAVPATAQVYPPEAGREGGGTYDGGSVNNPFLAPDGTKSAPVFSFTSDPDTGIFHESIHEINFTSNGEEIIETRYNGSSSSFQFYNIANTTAGDWGFSYTGGAASSTFYVSIPGVAGFAHMQVGGEPSTGGQITLGSTVVGNKLYFYASDTLANAIRWETDFLGTDYTDVVPAVPSGVNTITLPAETGELPTYQTGTSTLTESSATALLRFSLSQGSFAQGQVHHQIYCADATDEVTQRCEMDFSCYNDAGTEECSFVNSSCTTNAESGSGTAVVSAATAGITAGLTDIIEMTMNATCNLTQTTLENFWNIEFEKDGSWAAVTEQN